MSYATRFAPSPTGPLHLGHAFSALTAYQRAQSRGGRFHVRIEDIDRQRSKPEWTAQILEDLSWLGVAWDGDILFQSKRLQSYRAALEDLWARELLFACSCKRRDILEASSAPHGPVIGPDGIVYPGTCRANTRRVIGQELPRDVALRLDFDKALELVSTLDFVETGHGAPRTVGMSHDAARSQIGDVVLSRKDFFGSYHLSVVLDDAEQDITEVVRGLDLFEATHIHVLLQQLLGLPQPDYHHHRLIEDAQGKRLAKRDDARAILTYRDDGLSVAQLRALF